VKFLRNISIATKLIYLFLLVGVGSTIIVGVYSYYSVRTSLTERTFDQLTSIRVVKKSRIENFFSDRFRDINLISRTDDVEELIALLYTQKDASNTATQNNTYGSQPFDQFLSLYVKAYGYYDKFIVGDTLNRIIFTSGTSSDSLHFCRTDQDICSRICTVRDSTFKKRSIVFADFKNDEFNSNKPSYYISIPVFTNDSCVKGYVSLLISATSINNIMLENSSENGLGETGESYLVGSDLYMRSDSRFIPKSLMTQTVKTEATENAFNGNTGIKIINDYRGIPVLSSYSKLDIPGMNWIIIAEIDLKEAMIPVIQTRNDIFFLSALLVLFILAFTIIIARTISQPIIRLKNAAVKVGEGDFNTQVDINGKDEIGALAESFNAMTSKLKTTTDELHEREERLRHFYEATMDGIILHEEGKPLLVNHALSKLTDFSEEELMNKRIGEIITEIKNDSAIITAYESICLTKNGEHIPVEIQQGFVEYKGRRINAAVIRNISQRKGVEHALMEEREKRLSALIDGQEMERQRISRELHDGLGQYLIAIKLKMESIIAAQQSEQNKPLLEVQEMFDHTIDEIRKISDNLMPSILKEFGLETALRNLCKMMSQATGIRISFESLPLRKKPEEKVSTYLYRIAQEALNNIVKHAEATEASVQLLTLGNNIQLIIDDNGKGFAFDQRYKSKGNGIYNMRERISMIGGTFELKSSEDKGTSIEIKIPIHE
jgi:PAS domain S-box-containing protein